MTEKPDNIMARLAAPFDLSEVKFKPATVSGNRALALAYVDARVIMDRLDDVLGPGNWQTSYRELPEGVVCKLRVRINGEWCEHEDVGGFSEQPDDGDKLKAAFSDSLKRVAIHIGIGRYLYRLPQIWVDYDVQKKRFASTPPLPQWAKPGAASSAPVAKPASAQKPQQAPPQQQVNPAPASAPEPTPTDLHRTVTPEEAQQLKQRLEQTGADHKPLFEMYALTKLTDLPAQHLRTALQWCTDHARPGPRSKPTPAA